MNLFIFSIRDRASENFGNPVFVFAAGQAIRSFGDEVNRADAQNPYYQHPEDYDLYALGVLDTSTGIITPTSPPEMVAVGKNLVVTKN